VSKRSKKAERLLYNKYLKIVKLKYEIVKKNDIYKIKPQLPAVLGREWGWIFKLF